MTLSCHILHTLRHAAPCRHRAPRHRRRHRSHRPVGVHFDRGRPREEDQGRPHPPHRHHRFQLQAEDFQRDLDLRLRVDLCVPRRRRRINLGRGFWRDEDSHVQQHFCKRAVEPNPPPTSSSGSFLSRSLGIQGTLFDLGTFCAYVRIAERKGGKQLFYHTVTNTFLGPLIIVPSLIVLV